MSLSRGTDLRYPITGTRLSVVRMGGVWNGGCDQGRRGDIVCKFLTYEKNFLVSSVK